MKKPRDTRPLLIRALWWLAGRKWDADWHRHIYRGKLCAACDDKEVEYVIKRDDGADVFFCRPCFKQTRRINPESGAKAKQKQRAANTAQEL